MSSSNKLPVSTDEVSYGARLWRNLLSLMIAHAWLEQHNREIRELANGERAVVNWLTVSGLSWLDRRTTL